MFVIGCHDDGVMHVGSKELTKNILADSERMLRVVARRWRETLHIRRMRSLADIVGVPGAAVPPLLLAGSLSSETIAWLLWCMSWWGMHDARSLFAKRLHPATRIVRWLSAVPLKLQEEHSALAMRLLAQTFDETRMLWRKVADCMQRHNAYLLDPRIIDVRFIWNTESYYFPAKKSGSVSRGRYCGPRDSAASVNITTRGHW